MSRLLRPNHEQVLVGGASLDDVLDLAVAADPDQAILENFCSRPRCGVWKASQATVKALFCIDCPNLPLDDVGPISPCGSRFRRLVPGLQGTRPT